MKRWVLVLLLSGCAMKTKILEVPLVSQTYSNVPAGAHLQMVGPAYGHYCANGDDTSGMLDEATAIAQRRGQFDFISEVQVSREANCISLQGVGQRLVQAAVTPPILHPTSRRHKSH
jgi:hypothetical protein